MVYIREHRGRKGVIPPETIRKGCSNESQTHRELNNLPKVTHTLG